MTNELHSTDIGRDSSAANIAAPDTCKYSEETPYRQFMESSRQERTVMIENLIEMNANVIDAIWHPKFLMENQKAKVMPTKGFCNEILKRSKATYSTVQISLFYIFRVKKAVHEKLYQRYKNNNMPTNPLDDLMCCGRRMFLASLMVASKYLHDKNYHNKAWAKITGLDIKEINAAELAFLKLIDYRLHISKPTFDKWYAQLHSHIQKGCKPNTINTTTTTTAPTVGCNIETNAIKYTINNPHAVMNNSITANYPSPPLDDTTNNRQHHLAPMSPPTMELKNDSHSQSLSRADSGVSFDLLTPPTKRKTLSESDSIIANKRLCQ